MTDGEVSARIAARIAAARRRLDGRRELYAVKRRRRDAGLAERHATKLARLGAVATTTERTAP